MRKRHYNIYHGSMRINSLPLSEDELEKIMSSNTSIKKMGSDNRLIEIPLKKIRVVKCTIV